MADFCSTEGGCSPPSTPSPTVMYEILKEASKTSGLVTGHLSEIQLAKTLQINTLILTFPPRALSFKPEKPPNDEFTEWCENVAEWSGNVRGCTSVCDCSNDTVIVQVYFIAIPDITFHKIQFNEQGALAPLAPVILGYFPNVKLPLEWCRDLLCRNSFQFFFSMLFFALATEIPERCNVFHIEYPSNWRYPEINNLFNEFGK